MESDLLNWNAINGMHMHKCMSDIKIQWITANSHHAYYLELFRVLKYNKNEKKKDHFDGLLCEVVFIITAMYVWVGGEI